MSTRGTAERVETHWLVLDYAANPPIRIDARALDRILAIGSELILEVGPAAIAVTLEGGEAVARSIVEQLAMFTRAAPITNDAVLRHAKERLELARRGRRENGSLIVFVGTKDIWCHDGSVYYGDARVCSMADLWRPRSESDALCLDGTAWIQPSLVLLSLAAGERCDDPDTLAEKIRHYEALDERPRGEAATERGSTPPRRRPR